MPLKLVPCILKNGISPKEELGIGRRPGSGGDTLIPQSQPNVHYQFQVTAWTSGTSLSFEV